MSGVPAQVRRKALVFYGVIGAVYAAIGAWYMMKMPAGAQIVLESFSRRGGERNWQVGSWGLLLPAAGMLAMIAYIALSNAWWPDDAKARRFVKYTGLVFIVALGLLLYIIIEEAAKTIIA